ncbi:permease-like cell division protein FtsX [Litoribrevibacter euphylliae]|uniref:Cell division protein FtsX n=1 Tax=Litoribrevibacter euphylliae TaxID=1834034 RepID=A0ABV7HL13_9GAMM
MFGKKDKADSRKAVKGATVKGARSKDTQGKPAQVKGAVKSGASVTSASAVKGATRQTASRPAKPAAKAPVANNASNETTRRSAKKPSSFGSLIQYHRDCMRSSWHRLNDARLATAMTAALVAISMSLPMLLLLVVSNLQQLSSDWQDQTSLSAYLSPGMSDAQQLKLTHQVQGLAAVDKTRLISPDEGLEEFKGLAGAELLSLFDSNPLPAVIEVVPNIDRSNEGYQIEISDLVRELSAMQGIDDVNYDMQWVERLVNYVGLAERFALIIGVLLALGAVLAISNSIRLEIENRRQEIIVIKLVGGTDSFIRLPFLYSGFWYGVVGATLATLCLWLVGFWLSPYVSRLLSLYSSDVAINYLGMTDIFWLYFCAIVLAVVGAWLAVYRHLDEIEPE